MVILCYMVMTFNDLKLSKTCLYKDQQKLKKIGTYNDIHSIMPFFYRPKKKSLMGKALLENDVIHLHPFSN